MAQGLQAALPPGDLTVVVNTADDFELYGLWISPDLDTVMYTLAGIADPVNGWGVAGDTRNTLEAIARYGQEPWFLLGDQDFATHILRTARLRTGMPLSVVTTQLSDALGIQTRIVPMTYDRISGLLCGTAAKRRRPGRGLRWDRTGDGASGGTGRHPRGGRSGDRSFEPDRQRRSDPGNTRAARDPRRRPEADCGGQPDRRWLCPEGP